MFDANLMLTTVPLTPLQGPDAGQEEGAVQSPDTAYDAAPAPWSLFDQAIGFVSREVCHLERRSC
jgi:hypothetical protein